MVASSKEASLAVNQAFKEKNERFFLFVKPKTDADAKKINRALRKLSKVRKKILMDMKNEKIENSFLGMLGRAMEPLTQYAGFDWRVNVSFLSSFAARESAVATLGSIYENNKSDGARAEETMAKESGYTPLHALAMIIFMLFTPPCIATMIVIKMQTNSYRWMAFAILFPITLGILIASLIFSLGQSYQVSGVEGMGYFYALLGVTTLILGFLPNKQINWKGGFKQKVR